VTHDLRTPLTSIKASVTTLLHENRPSSGDLVKLDSEDRTEMLQVIDEEADRLNRFVESLVELARIEAGEMRLRRRWITVDEIFETAVERARPFTGKHRVLVNVEPSIPLILVDAQAMAEVVYTLIDNAAKYSPEGTIIRISAEQEGEQTVRFIVADHGEGIPPQLRTRVFDKFFRLEHGRANSHPPPGTGMGLAIAKGIVEAHGGRIWIEGTATGVGTMVIVELPIGDETVDVTRTAAGSDNLPVKAGTDND
jgi:two-component system sensor histidine kinase KdpD